VGLVCSPFSWEQPPLVIEKLRFPASSFFWSFKENPRWRLSEPLPSVREPPFFSAPYSPNWPPNQDTSQPSKNCRSRFSGTPVLMDHPLQTSPPQRSSKNLYHSLMLLLSFPQISGVLAFCYTYCKEVADEFLSRVRCWWKFSTEKDLSDFFSPGSGLQDILRWWTGGWGIVNISQLVLSGHAILSFVPGSSRFLALVFILDCPVSHPVFFQSPVSSNGCLGSSWYIRTLYLVT